MAKRDPINPTDDDARALAQALLAEARFAALAVSHPQTGTPYVSRVSFARLEPDMFVTLISDLSLHSTALKASDAVSVLVGEPGDKGDPLTHPRMTLICTGAFIDKAPLKTRYLALHPKAQLYFDFADFRMVQFNVQSAHLNGGFGKAFVLNSSDLYAPKSA